MSHDHHHHGSEDHQHHGHSHDHGHSHAPQSGPAKTRLWFLVLLTVSYMVAEIVAGLWSGSLALLADAGHMAIDSAAILLSLFAAWVASLPPNANKTFGYYRAEILAALINGAALIVIAIGILYEAWTRFQTPQVVQGEMLTWVASGGLVVNIIGISLVHGKHSHSLNMRGVWLHLLTDLLGSVSAIIAGILIWKWNWNLADPIISAVISVLILWGAWQLVRDCVNVLLEAVPKGMDLNEIRTSLEAMPGVTNVHDLHIWTVTSGVPSLSAHVTLKEGVSSTEMLRQITELLCCKYGIDHVTVQLEPEGYSHDTKNIVCKPSGDYR